MGPALNDETWKADSGVLSPKLGVQKEMSRVFNHSDVVGTVGERKSYRPIFLGLSLENLWPASPDIQIPPWMRLVGNPAPWRFCHLVDLFLPGLGLRRVGRWGHVVA